jgi:hypothetical protein
MTPGQLVVIAIVQVVCALLIGVPCYYLGRQTAELKAELDRDREFDELLDKTENEDRT